MAEALLPDAVKQRQAILHDEDFLEPNHYSLIIYIFF